MVVDYSMPEVDGIQFLTSIRNANCMKILLTGIADEREAVAAFNAGLIDCYLKKTDVEMARKLASALDDAKQAARPAGTSACMKRERPTGIHGSSS